ncbi:MAG: hypothetical protein AAF789_08450, partial [Bacteroidota bacterium]
MKKITYLIGFLVAFGLLAQDKNALKFAKSIKSADLKEHLSILASDEYEGRETGKKGQKLAARYIADFFNSLGFDAPVNGSNFQEFNLNESSIVESYFRKGDDKKLGFEDYVYYSRSETSGEEYVTVVMADQENSSEDSYKDAYVVYVVDQLGGMRELTESAKEAGAEGIILVIKN